MRCAVVGLGFIGTRHASIIDAHEKMTLVATCDIKGAKAVGAEKYSGNFYGSFKDLLQAEKDIDTVVIATPNGLHAEQAIAALNAGKNVIVEKPLALTTADAITMQATADANGKTLHCVLQNRFSAPVKWLKELVDQNRLGTVFNVQVNCFWNRDERYYRKGDWKGTVRLDGGPLFTQFSHFVDILIWIFGDVTVRHAAFRNDAHEHNTEFEDGGNVLFTINSGGSGSLNYSTAVWDRNMESSITVMGERGSLRIGGQYMDKVEYCHIKEYECPSFDGSLKPNYYGTHQGSAANHEAFYEAILKEKKPTTTLQSVPVVDFIESVYSKRVTSLN